MKNTTKAAVAAVAGGALLLGGAGSLAFWTDTEPGGTAVIASGNLDLGTPAAGGWTIQQVVAGNTPLAPVAFTPATGTIVPGDVLTYTQNVPVTLQGNNIAATFVGDVVVAPVGAADPEDLALASAIQTGATVGITSVTGAGLTRVGTTNVVTAPDAGTSATGTVAVTTTITFPYGTSAQYNAAKLGQLSYSVAYTLTQTPTT